MEEGKPSRHSTAPFSCQIVRLLCKIQPTCLKKKYCVYFNGSNYL